MSELRKKALKRRLIKATLIASSVLAAILGVWLMIYFVEVTSLIYVDDLRAYSLSKIQGSVEEVDRDAYSRMLSPLRGDGKKSTTALVYSPLFPESVPSVGTEAFLFAETVKPERSYFDRWEVYVRCLWSEEGFASEKLRLESFSGPGKGPTARADLFPLPSLVYKYESGKFLYALLDESTFSIHYIYLCEVGSIDNIVFEKRLAPTKPWLQW